MLLVAHLACQMTVDACTACTFISDYKYVHVHYL